MVKCALVLVFLMPQKVEAKCKKSVEYCIKAKTIAFQNQDRRVSIKIVAKVAPFPRVQFDYDPKDSLMSEVKVDADAETYKDLKSKGEAIGLLRKHCKDTVIGPGQIDRPLFYLIKPEKKVTLRFRRSHPVEPFDPIDENIQKEIELRKLDFDSCFLNRKWNQYHEMSTFKFSGAKYTIDPASDEFSCVARAISTLPAIRSLITPLELEAELNPFVDCEKELATSLR